MEFRILGPLEVTHRGRPVQLRAAKPRSLLGLLLVFANKVVSTDELVEALWEGAPPRSAAKLIQVYVSQLRALDPARGTTGGRLARVPPGYVLRVGPEELDLSRFETLLEKGRVLLRKGEAEAAAAALAEGLSLWRGPALADFVYQEWARVEAERLEDLRLAALEEHADAELARGRAEHVVGPLRGLVAEHPHRERLRARLMLALYRCGRQADALAVYRDARRALVEELGIEPGTELQQLEAAILNQDPALEAPLVSSPATNLPRPAGTIVGRRMELADLAELLSSPSVPIVTLTGPGGSGKTRLAVEAAWAARALFRDGVVFVGLGALSGSEAVARGLAAALAIREEEALEEALRRSLESKALLLVLDNFEHVAAEAALLARLADGAPDLKMLVTSRRLLRLSAEQVYEVGPLPPGDSIELFLERAKRARPDFRMTAESAPEVAEICARLDGLPLALELAAARLRVLTTAGLLSRLERRLPLLTEGHADAPERQRTLAATIQWSHDLLRESDRVLFASLGVFAGGWTVAAAEAVAGDDYAAVVDALGRLLDISLIRSAGPAAEPRFEMLETIREFALDRLAASGLEDEVRERHARYHLELAERESPELRGPGQAAALGRLEAEQANLVAAMQWACASRRSDLAFPLASFLWRFWWVRGSLGEGRRLLAQALALEPEPGHEATRASVLEGAAALAWGQADAPGAKAHAEEALALFRSAGEKPGIARALNHLGLVSQETGDLAAAKGYFEESGALAAQVGNERGRAVAVVNLGGLALIEGDYERARELSEEGRRLHRTSESLDGEAISLLNLGFAALETDRLEDAEASLEEGLGLFRELGFREYVSFCLEGLAGVCAARGRAAEAAGLLGRAEAEREAAGGSLGPYERRLHERTLARVRDALDPDTLETEWRAEGSGQPVGQPVESSGR